MPGLVLRCSALTTASSSRTLEPSRRRTATSPSGWLHLLQCLLHRFNQPRSQGFHVHKAVAITIVIRASRLWRSAVKHDLPDELFLVQDRVNTRRFECSQGRVQLRPFPCTLVPGLFLINRCGLYKIPERPFYAFLLRRGSDT